MTNQTDGKSDVDWETEMAQNNDKESAKMENVQHLKNVKSATLGYLIGTVKLCTNTNKNISKSTMG